MGKEGREGRREEKGRGKGEDVKRKRKKQE